MTITLTIPDAQAARLATVLRARAGLPSDPADPKWKDDQTVITAFFAASAQAEVRAVRIQVLEDQYAAQKLASAPDATLADTLLQVQRLREA